MKHIFWFLVFTLLAVLCLGFLAISAAAQEVSTFPLIANGPYLVGQQTFTYFDASRDRTLDGYVYYPAGANPTPIRPLVARMDAPPYADAAPFALIFYSHGSSLGAADTLSAGPYLASYGYAVVSINHYDPANRFVNITHRPLDLLFVLDQIAAGAEGMNSDLVSLISTERVGVTGYSLGATTTIELAGARIDPAAYVDYCATTDESGRGTPICDISAENWQEVLDTRAVIDPQPVEGEPWPAFSDLRITAAVAVAPCLAPFFGERGLADATVPILLIGLDRDERCPFERDAQLFYDSLGSPDRALLTMFSQGHADAVLNRDPQKIFNAFALAFFGLHLHDQTEYAQYLTSEFVSQFDDLAWVSTP